MSRYSPGPPNGETRTWMRLPSTLRYCALDPDSDICCSLQAAIPQATSRAIHERCRGLRLVMTSIVPSTERCDDSFRSSFLLTGRFQRLSIPSEAAVRRGKGKHQCHQSFDKPALSWPQACSPHL